MIVGNKDLIRDINTQNVLETIIKEAPISRIDLTKPTRLTKGTISTIVQNLIDTGLVVETELISSKGVGRKKLLLELSPKGGFCISVDLQKNKMKIMSADLCGQKIFSSIKENYSLEDIFTEIRDFIITHYKNHKNDYKILFGISIATDTEIKDEIDSKILLRALKTEYNVPVHIFNRGHFAVLGENSYSTKKDYVLFIDNINSISVGLINNGSLFLGSNKNALNIENIQVGNFRGKGLKGKKQNLKQFLSLSMLLELSGETLGKDIDLGEFLLLFSSKDKAIQQLTTNYIAYMSATISNLVWSFDPDIVVVNCPLVSSSDEVFLRLKQSLGKNKGILYRSMLKEDATIYGGVVYCIMDFLRIKSFKPSKCYFREMTFV